MLYKFNNWLFRLLIEAEYENAKAKENKYLDKYKIFHKRRTYLSNVVLEINNEEVDHD